MKNKWMYLLLFGLFTSACSSLKTSRFRATEETNATSHRSSKLELQKLNTAGRQLTDSSNSDYVLQIWPSGAFSYHPEAGFKGEAKKLLIKGNSSRALAYQQQRSSVQQLKAEAVDSLYTSNSSQQESHTKNKTQPSFWLYGLLAVFIAVLAWRLWVKW